MAETIYNASLVIMSLGILLVMARLIIGPTSADRIISMDVMTVISLPLIFYIALVSGRGIYADVALVYGLLSFLGVLAVARFYERGL